MRYVNRRPWESRLAASSKPPTSPSSNARSNNSPAPTGYPGSPIEDRSPVDIRLGPSWTPPFSAMMTPDEHGFVASSNLHDDEGCFPISTTGVSDLRGRPPRLDTTAPRSRTSSCPSTHSLNGPAPDEDGTARPWPEGDEAARTGAIQPGGPSQGRPGRRSNRLTDGHTRCKQYDRRRRHSGLGTGGRPMLEENADRVSCFVPV